MANVTPQSVVRQIGSLFEGVGVIGLSDRQLLERFIATQIRQERRRSQPWSRVMGRWS